MIFQDGSHGGHLGFPIGKFFSYFDLQVSPILPIKFQVNRVQEKKRKIDSVTAAILDFRYNRF